MGVVDNFCSELARCSTNFLGFAMRWGVGKIIFIGHGISVVTIRPQNPFVDHKSDAECNNKRPNFLEFILRSIMRHIIILQAALPSQIQHEKILKM